MHNNCNQTVLLVRLGHVAHQELECNVSIVQPHVGEHADGVSRGTVVVLGARYYAAVETA